MTQPLRPQAFTLIELPKAVSRSAALKTSKGFTLIELLVVITIIIVLLALLTPALEKAVYQAQLAACGAQLKTVGTGVTTSSFDYRRMYPTRGASTPHGLRVQLPGFAVFDDRAEIRKYLGSFNQLLTCPFGKQVDLEGSDSLQEAGPVQVYAMYWMWFGWGYGGDRGGPGMKRLGDGWTWDNRQYNLLVQDFDVVEGTVFEWSSHPDADGVLSLNTEESQVNTHSSWENNQRRGLIDMNFGYTDLSVRRHSGITRPNNWTGEKDDRMALVPNFASGFTGQMGMVPRD